MFERLISFHPAVLPALTILALLTVAIIADLITKRVLLVIVTRVIQSSGLRWGDELARRNLYGRVAQAVPALIVFLGLDLVPDINPTLAQFLKNVSLGYLVLVVTLTLSALLSAGSTIYEQQRSSQSRPIRGFIQLLQIIVYVIGAVFIISVLIDRSPLLLLSGFGAMTAVLLLVFKDTILGLVASIQLNANDMVRVGDWIEMPKFGADGDVIEVNLHTVKVQNFDRTITTIPSHALISDSFKNWRGMSDSGGRRIKRALMIDQSSIRFLDDQEAVEYERFELLRDYLQHKRAELSEALEKSGASAESASIVNRRRLTNVGTFRAYVYAYLKNHSAINPDATLLVRQLRPGPQGLPLEIYCFTRTTDWLPYEGIQADVFDHIIAITPEFDLRLFQEPAGTDLADLRPRITDQSNGEHGV